MSTTDVGSMPTTSIKADGFGDLTVYLTDGMRVRIDKADPRIRLDVHMVAGFRDVHPWWAVCTDDGTLTLRDDYGHRYIYRVDWGSFDPATNSFAAEWPD